MKMTTTATTTLKVTYEGKDITEDVNVMKCFHTMYAADHADMLEVSFEDNNEWDAWECKQGDEIKIDEGDLSTGTLYVARLDYRDGFFTITAASAPPSVNDRKSRSWEKVKLTDLGKKIAGTHGLGFKSYSITDVKYDYLYQDNQGDFEFLNSRCILEGVGFLVYNKKLVMYDDRKMTEETNEEEITVSENNTYELFDDSHKLYKACEFTRGQYSGKATESNSSSKTYVPDFDFIVGSQTEANRFAKNLLYYKNKNRYNGTITSTEVLGNYAAGSVITLKCDQASSWNGKIFINQIRNDYIHKFTKVFFRRVV